MLYHSFLTVSNCLHVHGSECIYSRGSVKDMHNSFGTGFSGGGLGVAEFFMGRSLCAIDVCTM